MKKTPQQIIHDLDALHQFLHEAEGLKRLLRHSWLSDGRKESVAEHSWRMALMGLVLYRELEFEVDIGRVLKMILIHDLAEVYAGDPWALDGTPPDKHDKELQALKTLTQHLPKAVAEEFIELWQEFEVRETNEAKFAVALDKLEVLIQHNEADTKTWNEKEYEFNYYYGYDKVEFSQTLKLFRDLVLAETIEKIDKEIE